jgi:hypothetical protein
VRRTLLDVASVIARTTEGAEVVWHVLATCLSRHDVIYHHTTRATNDTGMAITQQHSIAQPTPHIAEIEPITRHRPPYRAGSTPRKAKCMATQQHATPHSSKTDCASVEAAAGSRSDPLPNSPPFFEKYIYFLFVFIASRA